MDLISRDALRELVEEREYPCVSIYLPTHRVWNEAKQDPTRLDNLLRQAEAKLRGQGVRPDGVDELLAPARDLLGRDGFWKHQSDGLAVLITPNQFFSYRLPLEFEELVVVGDRLHVKPLMPLFADDGYFYVLTLSQGGIRLFEGSHYNMGEIGLEDVPNSLAEALKYDELETQLQFHSGTGQQIRGGDRGAMFHGQSDAGDKAYAKQNILRFFRTVDNGVRDLLAEETAPLVLVGIEYLQGLYREANHYQHLVEVGIDAHPDDLNANDVHERAWSVVEPLFRQARQEALQTYQQLAGKADERAATDLETVVPAAFFQRIDTAFISQGAHRWGTFDAERSAVEVHSEAQPDDDDLLDFVAAHTFLNDGAVYVLDPKDMPSEDPVAAILRY